MKVAILLLLVCAYLVDAGTLVRDTPWGPSFDPKACSVEADYYIRDKYWYYLTDAQLCYIAHIQYQGGFLFIHQYRNYIGTFMAISKYMTPGRRINVVTFVRLGDGVKTSYHVFEPIQVAPFAISMDLGYGEYQVPRWDSHEQPQWNEQWARQQFYRSPSAEEIATRRCARLDDMVRENYYYYLKDAILLSQSNSVFGNYCYCMNTYVNLMGIWQVIGSDSPTGMKVNTFVRLGDGYAPNNVKKCVPYPSFNSWSL